MQADYSNWYCHKSDSFVQKEKNALFGYMQGSTKTSVIRRMYECFTKSFQSDGT